MFQVTINGTAHRFPEGLTINRALRLIGLEVPTLCHDDRLQPYGSCRLCTVEVKGMGALATACNTQIRDGMEILTDSPAVTGVRRTLLGLLAANYPAEAVAASSAFCTRSLSAAASTTGSGVFCGCASAVGVSSAGLASA